MLEHACEFWVKYCSCGMMIYMKIFDVVKQAVGLKFPTQITSISWFLRTGKELSRTHELEFWKVDDMEYGESVLCSNFSSTCVTGQALLVWHRGRDPRASQETFRTVPPMRSNLVVWLVNTVHRWKLQRKILVYALPWRIAIKFGSSLLSGRRQHIIQKMLHEGRDLLPLRLMCMKKVLWMSVSEFSGIAGWNGGIIHSMKLTPGLWCLFFWALLLLMRTQTDGLGCSVFLDFHGNRYLQQKYALSLWGQHPAMWNRPQNRFDSIPFTDRLGAFPGWLKWWNKATCTHSSTSLEPSSLLFPWALYEIDAHGARLLDEIDRMTRSKPLSKLHSEVLYGF